MRSSRSMPVSLSSSYLTLEPIGISTMAVNSLGRCSPGVTSCHACVMIANLVPGTEYLFNQSTGGGRERLPEETMLGRIQFVGWAAGGPPRRAGGPPPVTGHIVLREKAAT